MYDAPYKADILVVVPNYNCYTQMVTICQFEIYSFRENVTTNLGESVVIKLARELVRGNYHLFFNNYFTTVPLLEKLLQDEIYACGTFRIDTKFIPTHLKNLTR